MGRLFSDVICWATGGMASHTWLLVDHDGVDVVYESANSGFRAINYDIWNRNDQMIELWVPSVELLPAMPLIYQCLGENYDFLGLAGMSFVEVSRDFFHRKANNPWYHHDQLFCSEIISKVMQDPRVNYPWANLLKPYNTDPMDIRKTLMASGARKIYPVIQAA